MGKLLQTQKSKYILLLISPIFLFLFSTNTYPSEIQNLPLTKGNIQKIKHIAGIITSEITKRNIKTVMVKDFTDINGKPSSAGKAIAEEFTKQLISSAGKQFSVVNSNADAVITGTVAPFKEDNKWQIKIKVVSSDRGKIITSYSGVLRMHRKN